MIKLIFEKHIELINKNVNSANAPRASLLKSIEFNPRYLGIKPVTRVITQNLKTGKIYVGKIDKKYFSKKHGGNLKNF